MPSVFLPLDEDEGIDGAVDATNPDFGEDEPAEASRTAPAAG